MEWQLLCIADNITLTPTHPKKSLYVVPLHIKIPSRIQLHSSVLKLYRFKAYYCRSRMVNEIIPNMPSLKSW